MAEMRVDSVVAGPAFSAAGEVKPAPAHGVGVCGTDPLTTAARLGISAASTALLAADGVATDNEATAGMTGTTNVQNFSRAEGDHAARLRYPVTGGGTAPVSV